MDKFSIQLTKPAAADLDAIQAAVSKLLLQAIAALGLDPFADGFSKKKLKGFRYPYYRLRSADCRVIYRIDPNRVTVLRVINRKHLEKVIKQLRKSK